MNSSFHSCTKSNLNYSFVQKKKLQPSLKTCSWKWNTELPSHHTCCSLPYWQLLPPASGVPQKSSPGRLPLEDSHQAWLDLQSPTWKSQPTVLQLPWPRTKPWSEFELAKMPIRLRMHLAKKKTIPGKGEKGKRISRISRVSQGQLETPSFHKFGSMETPLFQHTLAAGSALRLPKNTREPSADVISTSDLVRGWSKFPINHEILAPDGPKCHPQMYIYISYILFQKKKRCHKQDYINHPCISRHDLEGISCSQQQMISKSWSLMGTQAPDTAFTSASKARAYSPSWSGVDGDKRKQSGNNRNGWYEDFVIFVIFVIFIIFIFILRTFMNRSLWTSTSR